MQSILKKQPFRDFDWLLAIIPVAIVCFGIWQIYNAQPTENFWQKQIIGLIISICMMAIIAFSDYRKIVDAAPVFYGIGLFFLILVIIPGLGMRINGHQAWIKVPFIGQFQPSEFVKFPVMLMLVKYFGKPRKDSLKVSEVFTGILILVIPLLLIMKEPDAGTAVTYFPILAVILFLSSIKIRWVIFSILSLLILMPAAYWAGVHSGAIKNYQQDRINNVLNPENADPRGNGFQTFQSIISIGKGGVTGIDGGDSESSQSALKFLPEPQSDFIFAVTGENTGFVGCVSLLLAYAFLLSRLIAAARDAGDRIGMLMTMAITGELTFQIFMNIGMAMGFMPVVGVPLPLMSAGLSSILATFIAIGFVISVRMRRFIN